MEDEGSRCVNCGEPVAEDEVCACSSQPLPSVVSPGRQKQAEGTPRACRQCGKQYLYRLNYSSYECSRACTSAYYEAHYFRDRQCFHCGEKYRASFRSSFCSGACRVASHRAGKKAPSNGENVPPVLKLRSRVLGGNGNVPTFLKLRFQVLERDNFRCRYCGRGKEDGVKLQIDHVHPKSKGGKWELNNLITACLECNLGKGDRVLQAKIMSQGTK